MKTLQNRGRSKKGGMDPPWAQKRTNFIGTVADLSSRVVAPTTSADNEVQGAQHPHPSVCVTRSAWETGLSEKQGRRKAADMPVCRPHMMMMLNRQLQCWNERELESRGRECLLEPNPSRKRADEALASCRVVVCSVHALGLVLSRSHIRQTPVAEAHAITPNLGRMALAAQRPPGRVHKA